MEYCIRNAVVMEYCIRNTVAQLSDCKILEANHCDLLTQAPTTPKNGGQLIKVAITEWLPKVPLFLRICNSCFAQNCIVVACWISNRAYKAGTDWNHFHSLWESKGYKVESQNGQLRLTCNLIWASLEAVIIVEQETIKFMRTRALEAITLHYYIIILLYY